MQRYELGEPSFSSGCSTFYRATNSILGSEVVVRRLDVDPERAEDQRATFFRGQRHIASLRHPHIQKTLDVFEEDGALWSVHPFVPSRPTDQWVAEHGPFALADAARIASHIADALSYLHQRGSVRGSRGFIRDVATRPRGSAAAGSGNPAVHPRAHAFSGWFPCTPSHASPSAASPRSPRRRSSP